MRIARTFARLAGVAAVAALALGPASAAVADDGPSVVFTMTDPRITESSGLVASRLHKGVYWTHNDSDDGPYVYAVDSKTGKTLARVTMRGIGTARDVEAISIGPDDNIYVGDIGDNLNGSWPHVWIYKFPEPKTLADTTVTATQYTVQYSDGPRDAESLMIDPKTGRAYIASKNEDGGHLYQGPKTLSSSGTNIFRRVDDIPLWMTDGAFSPDGSRLVVRGYFGALEYRWSQASGGKLGKKVGQLDVPLQRQGESVCFTPDGRALMVGSEGSDSEVWRVPLSGAYLPDSVAASANGSPSGAASGSEDAGSGSGSSGSEGGGNLTVGAVAVAAVLALLLLGKRTFRRGRG